MMSNTFLRILTKPAIMFSAVAIAVTVQTQGREEQDVARKAHDAINNHDCVQLAQLLSRLSSLDDKGRLLLDSIEVLDIAATRMMLDAGADPNYKIGGSTTTPLMSAARLGSGAITKLLLSRGADPNGRALLMPPASCPLYEAVTYRCESCVVALLKAGADPNMRTRFSHSFLPTASAARDGLTPLMSASIACDYRIVGLLVNAGADVTLKDDAGYDAAMWVDSCHTKISEMETLLHAKGKQR